MSTFKMLISASKIPSVSEISMGTHKVCFGAKKKKKK